MSACYRSPGVGFSPTQKVEREDDGGGLPGELCREGHRAHRPAPARASFPPRPGRLAPGQPLPCILAAGSASPTLQVAGRAPGAFFGAPRPVEGQLSAAGLARRPSCPRPPNPVATAPSSNLPHRAESLVVLLAHLRAPSPSFPHPPPRSSEPARVTALQ